MSKSMSESKSESSAFSHPHQSRQKKDIQRMFAGIAGRYDFANHFLSGGIDYYWRTVLVNQVKACQPTRVIDLATGSGDVAFALRRVLPDSTSITGMDFCAPMLAEARKKQSSKNISPAIAFEEGDCMQLPLPDATADAVTIAFGVRNFENRMQGLREIHRILQPGGSLFILEFSQPDAWFHPIYFFYLQCILPIIARLATGEARAYQYLAGSIASFPSKQSLTQQIQETGFSSVNATSLTFGTVAIHHAVKCNGNIEHGNMGTWEHRTLNIEH